MKYLKLLMSAGTAGSGWVGINYYQQTQALKYPERIKSKGRLYAIYASKDFTPDQVGYGVHLATRAIHLVFREMGEQEVGKEFDLPYAQEALKKPRTPENHKAFATIDFNYWISQRNKGATCRDNVVIYIGSIINPDTRASIQETFAIIRESMP